MSKKSNKTIQGPATARLWLKLFRSFEKQLYDSLGDKGFDDISSMHFNIIRHLDPTGLTVSELAKDAGITKQAVGKIAGDLADKGYLAIEQSAEDRRVKYVNYTPKGEALLEQLIKQNIKIEKKYQKILGAENYQQMREDLQRLLDNE